MAEQLSTDVAIIGAGPVGLFAVFEWGCSCAPRGDRCARESGGQCAALYPDKPIYDIPGHPEIQAGELMTGWPAGRAVPCTVCRAAGRAAERRRRGISG